MIETVPLEEGSSAYAKMMAGKARFRMVLVTKNGNGQPGSRSKAFRPVGVRFLDSASATIPCSLERRAK